MMFGSMFGVAGGGGIGYDIILAGTIAVNSDFPLPAQVQVGWMYRALADVVDDDPTRTNTGVSVPKDSEIYWTGATWGFLDTNSIWGDDLSTIFKANSTRDVDVSNGLLIVDDIRAKDSTGIEFYNSSSQALLTFNDTTKLATFENGVQVNGDLTINEQTTDSRIRLQDSAAGSFPVLDFFGKSGAFGVAAIINAHPGSASTASAFQINKGVSTSGDVRVQFYKGDGSSDINCLIGCNVDSWFNNLTGNVGIGTDTPLEKLHVAGNTRQNGAVTVSDAASINDEAEISLTTFGDTVGCYGEIFIEGSPSAIATFTRGSDNSITLISATAGVFSLTDTDGYFVIYNSTNILTLKNRLGASKDIIYRVYKG